MRYLVTTCIAALLAVPAPAAVELFRANGTFVDGGVLSGTISIDRTAGAVTGANLTLTGTADDFSATMLNYADYYDQTGSYAAFVATDSAYSRYFALLLPTNLRGYTGGALYSVTNPSPNFFTSSYGIGSNAVSLTSGMLTSAVPEPAAWALMILGLGAAGAVKRRRQRVTVRYA